MWHIAADEETPLFAELVDARGILVLSADLGKPAEGNRLSLYELFLRYAHVWDVTSGLRMSLDAADGSAWLLVDCAARELTLSSLSEALLAFANQVRVWREIVATPPKALAEPGSIDLLLHSTMRA
jgi:hypothetical protein